MVRTIRWPLPVQKQPANIYKYILKYSLQNAEKVKGEILLSTKRLAELPEIHPPDKYKITTKDNSGHMNYIIIEYLIMSQKRK